MAADLAEDQANLKVQDRCHVVHYTSLKLTFLVFSGQSWHEWTSFVLKAALPFLRVFLRKN